MIKLVLLNNSSGMLMQMIFNPGGQQQGPNKSEGLDDNSIAPSPWANLLSVGLKILTAILGGGAAANNDGIDKVDNGSPMQVGSWICIFIPTCKYKHILHGIWVVVVNNYSL